MKREGRGEEGVKTRGGAKLRLEGKMKRRYLKKKSETKREGIATTNEIPSEMLKKKRKKKSSMAVPRCRARRHHSRLLPSIDQ